MKKILIALVAVLALGFTSQTAKAQTLKIVHIDYIKVIDSIPSMVDADKQIRAFLDKGQKTILEMETALDADYQAYILEKPTLSQIMQELREKQLMEQSQLIDYKKQSLENDLQILNERLYGPIEKSLEKAIEIVAQKYKVTYVLEKSQVMYVDPAGLDLTKEVRVELVRLEFERTGK